MSNAANVYVAAVDDDESLCRSLSRLLRQAVSHRSAEDFLANTKRPQFDCLLLDVPLGGMSGIELNQQPAAPGSTTPVVFITAHPKPEIRAQGLADSVSGFRFPSPNGRD